MEFSIWGPIRFGFGHSPRLPAPEGPEAVLAALKAPDTLGARFSALGPGEGLRLMSDWGAMRKARDGGGPKEREAFIAYRNRILQSVETGLRARLARAMEDPSGFRERLHQFWTDHFTVIGRRPRDHPLSVEYHDHAIRPHLTGTFAQMLRAAVTHPAMVLYLDQSSSFGPNSALGRRMAQKASGGLNENLAREVLELHTLGVQGHYTQDDVRQLAELFTGMTYGEEGLVYRTRAAEPGAEHVLGQAYGSPDRGLRDIEAALDDLAAHPDTAAHLARKLAVHFAADAPPEDLVEALRAAYAEGRGALLPVYRALLSHPAMAASFGQKVRQPLDYIAAGLRALGVTGEEIMTMERKTFLRAVRDPLERMGQPWVRPAGPNGWPEEAGAWITPGELAGRVDWAMQAPSLLRPRLPDPRAFLDLALGPVAGPGLALAVPRAESEPEGVGLVLASAEFNRR